MGNHPFYGRKIQVNVKYDSLLIYIIIYILYINNGIIYEVRSKKWYTAFVKESSLVSGKFAKHCVAIGR